MYSHNKYTQIKIFISQCIIPSPLERRLAITNSCLIIFCNTFNPINIFKLIRSGFCSGRSIRQFPRFPYTITYISPHCSQFFPFYITEIFIFIISTNNHIRFITIKFLNSAFIMRQSNICIPIKIFRYNRISSNRYFKTFIQDMGSILQSTGKTCIMWSIYL